MGAPTTPTPVRFGAELVPQGQASMQMLMVADPQVTGQIALAITVDSDEATGNPVVNVVLPQMSEPEHRTLCQLLSQGFATLATNMPEALQLEDQPASPPEPEAGATDWDADPVAADYENPDHA